MRRSVRDHRVRKVGWRSIAWVVAVAVVASAPSAFAQRDLDRAEWPKTDFARRTVDLAEIQSGGPPKDGIPAIDRPRLISVEAAKAWLKSKEPVIALRLRGERRAYPIQILMFHEIVNDEIASEPVAVTFCPLCNASFVFERRVGGRVLDFGTTGRLRKSDLVMYDRQTESWWQQFSGNGIVGHYAGTRLKVLPSEIVAFEDFAATYPHGKVLSRETGFVRPYGRNPYRGYDRIDQNPFLFSDPVDKRLPPMERVLSITVNRKHRIYPFAVLEKTAVVNAEIGGVPYVVLVKTGMTSPLDRGSIAEGRTIPAATAFDRRLDGHVLEFRARDGKLYDVASGSEWNLFGEAVSGPLRGKRLSFIDTGVHFAFAWLAFNPESEIVSALP
jgi:Protein of unknown function (DUF3179)